MPFLKSSCTPENFTTSPSSSSSTSLSSSSAARSTTVTGVVRPVTFLTPCSSSATNNLDHSPIMMDSESNFKSSPPAGGGIVGGDLAVAGKAKRASSSSRTTPLSSAGNSSSFVMSCTAPSLPKTFLKRRRLVVVVVVVVVVAVAVAVEAVVSWRRAERARSRSTTSLFARWIDDDVQVPRGRGAAVAGGWRNAAAGAVFATSAFATMTNSSAAACGSGAEEIMFSWTRVSLWVLYAFSSAVDVILSEFDGAISALLRKRTRMRTLRWASWLYYLSYIRRIVVCCSSF